MTLSFCDNVGHIFTLKAYDTDIIGYESEYNDYVFWIDNEYTNMLSVGNYYILPIRLVLPYPIYGGRKVDNIEKVDVNIESKSNIFKLLPSNIFLNCDKTLDITDSITLFLSSATKDSGTLGDLFSGIVCGDKEYILVPFYVIAYTTEEGTWRSNLKIKVTTPLKNLNGIGGYDNYEASEIYCPITVGGLFVDECEPLIINGLNMGITLPKDIIKAVYQELFYNKNANEALYNQKIKEYLINYMIIRGECGNYRSAKSSLEWFGWGDKLSLYQLIKTDNELFDQYMRSEFSISYDILKDFLKFRKTSLLSLVVKSYEEDDSSLNKIYGTDNGNDFNFDNYFYGEYHPSIESLFDKTLEVKYERWYLDDNPVIYTKNYFDYAFNELGLKLVCLASYYERYFLPIHMNVWNTLIETKAYTNDVKMVSYYNKLHLNQGAYFTADMYQDVKFTTDDRIAICKLIIEIDDNYNRFEEKQSYYVDDFCCEVPIEFSNSLDDDNFFYDCILVLSRNGEPILETHFQFILQLGYKSFVIVPRYAKEFFDATYWIDKEYAIDLCVNGYWYHKEFTMVLAEYTIDVGVLEYYLNSSNTYYSLFTAQGGDKTKMPKFNVPRMGEPELIAVSNKSFYNDLLQLYYLNDDESVNISRILDYANNYWENKYIADNNDYLNYIIYFDIVDSKGKKIPYDGIVVNDSKSLNEYIDIIKLKDNSSISELDALYRRFFLINYVKKTCLFRGILFKLKSASTTTPAPTASPIIANEEYSAVTETITSSTATPTLQSSTMKPVPTSGSVSLDDYDVYIMHDDSKYWGVMISKKPISLSIELEFHETIYDYTLNNANYVYKFKNFHSYKRFLVNRMRFKSCNGVNHVKDTDIVVTKVNGGYNDLYKFTPKLLYRYVCVDDDSLSDEIDENCTYIRDLTYNDHLYKEYSYQSESTYQMVGDTDITDSEWESFDNTNNIDYETFISLFWEQIKNYTYEFSDGTTYEKVDKINVDTLFNMDSTNKWKYENIDVNLDNVETVVSNTNIGILSLPLYYRKYKKGYYNVEVRYNIDDVVDHYLIKRCKFLVE